MLLKRPLFIAIVINFFFLALCVVFGDLKFGAVDDYFMAAVLTGAHGADYNPHLLFVNAIYGYALLPLYHLFPNVGWYYIGEMLSVFLGFTTICFVLLKKLGLRWGTIFSVLFIAFFASDFYLVIQFTQCASLLSASGMLIFAYAISESSNKKSFIMIFFGVLLLLWGSLMRWQAFLMGMPFFAIGMLFQIKKCWRVKCRTIAGLAIIFLAAYAMHDWDKKLYQTPEYKLYTEIQNPRAVFGDGSNYDKNAVYEDFEEMGYSGIDFHLLTKWTFYDTEAFHPDSLKNLLKVVEAYRTPLKKANLPRYLIEALGHSVQNPLFWIWFLFCILLMQKKQCSALYPWVSFVLMLFFMSYLLTQNRLVYRVESGFWLYASCMAIPLMARFRFEIPKYALYVFLIIMAIANSIIYATSGEIIRDPTTGNSRTITIEDSTDYSQVFSYIDSNPDKMFLLSMNTYMRFSHHKMPPYKAEPIGSYRRTVSLGYWTPYLPEITQALAEYGIENPIRDVVHDNVIVVNEGELKKFLEQHYYDSVSVDTIKRIGELEFYKYRVVHVEKTADASEVNND